MENESYKLNPDEQIEIEGKTYEVNIFDGNGQSACSKCDFCAFPLSCLCPQIECLHKDRFLYLTEK